MSSQELTLRRSLNKIILAITFGMVFFSVVGTPIGGAPFTGYIRALGVNDLTYGFIMATPVIGAFAQLFASYWLTVTGQRKKFFLIAGMIHRLLWIPIGLLPLVMGPSYRHAAILVISVLVMISMAANSVTGLSFWSWMGVLIPGEIRGSFFSRRTMIYTVSSALTGLLVGRVIDLTAGQGLTGFAVVFCVAALFGAADIACFFRVKHPETPVPEERPPFLRTLTEAFRHPNYRRFIAFITFWTFSCSIAGPFFNVYMLEYLKMNYLEIALLSQVLANVMTILTIRKWGHLLDRFGNRPVMAVCAAGITSLAAVWCFATPDNYIGVGLVAFFSGIFWPGFDMTNANLSISLAPKEKQSSFIANYNLMVSVIGTSVAYIIGGALMEFGAPLVNAMHLPFIMGFSLTGFHVLFILSSTLRLFALFFLFPRFHEENAESPRNMLERLLHDN